MARAARGSWRRLALFSLLALVGLLISLKAYLAQGVTCIADDDGLRCAPRRAWYVIPGMIAGPLLALAGLILAWRER